MIIDLSSTWIFGCRGFERALSKHFRVTVFDNRGTGYTSAPPANFSILQFANDTARLILADLFPERPIVILENCCVDQADFLIPLSPKSYLNQHIHEIQRAVLDGAKVTKCLY
jgi:hypothetical protein